MTAAQSLRLLAPTAPAEALTRTMTAAWQRRRQWSRTDTERWLNDHTDACLTRRPIPHTPRAKPVRYFGGWLKQHNTAAYAHAHAALAALPDDAARATAPIDRILP